jgi:hypothetical protein
MHAPGSSARKYPINLRDWRVVETSSVSECGIARALLASTAIQTDRGASTASRLRPERLKRRAIANLTRKVARAMLKSKCCPLPVKEELRVYIFCCPRAPSHCRQPKFRAPPCHACSPSSHLHLHICFHRETKIYLVTSSRLPSPMCPSSFHVACT